MDLKELIVELRRRTDIQYVEVQISILPKTTSVRAQIGMPEEVKPLMETFIREYRIEGAEWTSFNRIQFSPWHRVNFPIAY